MKVQALFYLAVIALLAGCAGERPELPKQRVVVIGDLHADINAARRAFQLADATNDQNEWIGGDLVVVQLGDIIGRSYEDREVLDFILEVREKAEAGGGRVHGGVTPHWARYGVIRINQEVSQWFAGHTDEPISAQGMNPGNYDDSVLMSRHFSEDVDENDCVMLEESLKLLNAKRMIVAHSVQDSITARCNEKVWAVDVGMSRYYGGPLQVLEIIDDDILSVIEY